MKKEYAHTQKKKKNQSRDFRPRKRQTWGMDKQTLWRIKAKEEKGLHVETQ